MAKKTKEADHVTEHDVKKLEEEWEKANKEGTAVNIEVRPGEKERVQVTKKN